MDHQKNIQRAHLQEQDREDWNNVHSQLQRVQKKNMSISDPQDEEEKEADHIARKVVNGEEATISGTSNGINRKGIGEAEASPQFQTKLESSKGSGQSLSADVQQEMGGKMGTDFSAVKIHTGNEAQEMSSSINAKAFTSGSDIYFNSGQYDTNSKAGKELVAHELVHTKQQGSNIKRVKDPVLEKGKEIIGDKVGKGNISVRTGDKWIMNQGETNERSEGNLISFNYEGENAANTHWLQFFNFDLKAYTPRGVIHQEGFLASGSGTVQYTSDFTKPKWFVDTADRNNPFYEANFLQTRTDNSTSIFDRPQGSSAHETIKGFVATKAKDMTFGSFVTTFETYLIQDDKAIYRTRWWAITSFSKDLDLADLKEILKPKNPLDQILKPNNAFSTPKEPGFLDPMPKMTIAGDNDVIYGTGESGAVDGLPENLKTILHDKYPAYKAIE